MTFPIRKSRVSLKLLSHPTHSQSQELKGTNNQRPAQAEPVMDGGDWKTRLSSDSRHRIINKIMDTLKRHLPVSGPEGLHELRKIAVRFEEKVYSAATSQSDYLRKISLKMLTMDTKSFNAATDSLPSNSAGHSKKSPNGKKSSGGKKSLRSRL